MIHNEWLYKEKRSILIKIKFDVWLWFSITHFLDVAISNDRFTKNTPKDDTTNIEDQIDSSIKTQKVPSDQSCYEILSFLKKSK